MTETTNLIFAGVGGQGVLLIAELTSLTAVRAGYDVKQTEVHGVSQRGGSVESHVRYGSKVYSPIVKTGEADVVVGLEKLEGLRYAHFVRPSPPARATPAPAAHRRCGAGEPPARGALPSGTAGGPTGEGGILLVNDHEIVPGSVANAAEKYPHHALDFLREKKLNVVAIPASVMARDLGDGRMANIILLGALSSLLNLGEALWMETLDERLPAKIREANLRAFRAGREALIADSRWQMADGR